jgi:hypothetical protein
MLYTTAVVIDSETARSAYVLVPKISLSDFPPPSYLPASYLLYPSTTLHPDAVEVDASLNLLLETETILWATLLEEPQDHVVVFVAVSDRPSIHISHLEDMTAVFEAAAELVVLVLEAADMLAALDVDHPPSSLEG